MKKLSTLLVCLCFILSFTKSQTWQSLPGGSINGYTMSVISFNGHRWFSGLFNQAGSIPAEFIVRHDGANWVATPSTVAPIRSFCVWNNTLYGAGSFPVGANTYGVAKWNGINWEYFGEVPSGFGFKTVCVFNNYLVFGGRCFSVEGLAINHLASWNGVSWSAFPFTITCSWLVLPDIRTLEEKNGQLYIGGDISDINGVTSSLIFKTDGSSVYQMGLEPNYFVSDIINYRDSIFAVGNFPFGPFPSNQGSPGITKTDNLVWEQVGHGLKMRPVTGTKYLTDLYVGGAYNNTCYNTPCNHADVGNLAKWNGSFWTDESLGLFNQNTELINFLYADTLTNTIYALGDFHTSRGDVADFIAQRSISVVPINLSSFTVKILPDKNIRLDWRDETPEDGVRFDVQVSNDGINFKSIGEVIERGDKKDYSFVYPNTDCGKLYFRLAFENKYSEVRTVIISCDVSLSSDGYNLRIQSKNSGTLTFFSTSGQTLARKFIASGSHQVPLNFPGGIYVARFVDNSGNVYNHKFFVNK